MSTYKASEKIRTPLLEGIYMSLTFSIFLNIFRFGLPKQTCYTYVQSYKHLHKQKALQTTYTDNFYFHSYTYYYYFLCT